MFVCAENLERGLSLCALLSSLEGWPLYMTIIWLLIKLEPVVKGWALPCTEGFKHNQAVTPRETHQFCCFALCVLGLV